MQLTALSQQLASLEHKRAVAQARIGKIQAARLSAARSVGSKESRNELSRLQSRVDHANQQLHQLQAGRDKKVDELHDVECQLASCERQLAGLSLVLELPLNRAAPATGKVQVSVPAGLPPRSPSPAKERYSPEETAAFERVQLLQKDRDEIKKAQARAQQATRDLKAQVQSLTAAAEWIVNPDSYVLLVAEYATEGLNRYLQDSGLPRCDAERDNTRFAQYLAAFTQADGQARRLSAELSPRACFAAFSALHSATRPNQYVPSLLARLLADGDSRLDAALRQGGEALKDAVQTQVTHSFAQVMEDVVNHAGGQLPGVAAGRRRRLPSGNAMSNREVATFHSRYRVLVQVQEPEATRNSIIGGAVEHATQMLGQIAEGYARKTAEVTQAQARLDESQLVQRGLIVQALGVDAQIEKARADLDVAANARRQLEAAGKAKDPRPSDAAIPKTLTASPSSSSLDPEARGMKLRGDEVRYKAGADELSQEIAQIDGRIREARAELRRCESELETTAAAHARDDADAQREHGEVRDELTGLRQQLDDLDGCIEAARAELQGHPARQAIISDRAWTRAIDRHVEPDNEALRARTVMTGYAGAYNSQADMARAVADVHAHVSQRPELQAVLAARTRTQFERAAAAVPGGVTDLVLDHGRQVGRGFSNALDQTSRATALTQSSYSLDFVQGRVVVSHLYPYVPHRQLQLAK